MGYPMTYRRALSRNGLNGEPTGTADLALLASDLRRLETDSRDSRHLTEYAELVGITPEQVQGVLDCFFDGGPWSNGRWSLNGVGGPLRRAAYAAERADGMVNTLQSALADLKLITTKLLAGGSDGA